MTKIIEWQSRDIRLCNPCSTHSALHDFWPWCMSYSRLCESGIWVGLNMDSVFMLHDIWVFSWEDPKLGVTQWLGVTHYLEASVLRCITSDACCWLALQLGQSAKCLQWWLLWSVAAWDFSPGRWIKALKSSLRRIRQKLYHLLWPALGNHLVSLPLCSFGQLFPKIAQVQGERM